MITGRRVAAPVACLLVLLWLPGAARGQADTGANAGTGVSDPVLVGVNAVLGGLTAGVGRWLRGGSVTKGAAVGLAGGALGYAGRRIAVEDFSGAGLLGRQVNAVGTSLVANAAADRGALSRLDLPVGPVILRFEPARRAWPVPRLRVWDAGWLVAAIVEDRLDLDWEESISSGAPVFRAPDHRLEAAYGRYVGGVIVLGMDPLPQTLAHERVHVLQFDAIQGYWGGPGEEWVASLLPARLRPPAWIETGIGAPLLVKAVSDGLSLRWDRRPWEIEADFLDGKSGSGTP
jgi:hypothetical protein